MSKLSADLKVKHADVPWGRIAGMRNRLVHGYVTVGQVLPGFKQRIEELFRP